MRKSKFSEHQIIAILKAVEAGRTVKDVCREHEISDATYYQWKSKYGGMQASDIRRLRELEDENRRLKQMCAAKLTKEGRRTVAAFSLGGARTKNFKVQLKAKESINLNNLDRRKFFILDS